MDKYPPSWFMPSNYVYEIADSLCKAIIHAYPETKYWQESTLKTIDNFLEENSFDLNEIVAKETEKCLKTYTNSQK